MKLFNLFKGSKVKHQNNSAALDKTAQQTNVKSALNIPGKAIRVQLIESTNASIQELYKDKDFVVTQDENGFFYFRDELNKGFKIKPVSIENLFGACSLSLAHKAGFFPTLGSISTNNSSYTYRLLDVLN